MKRQTATAAVLSVLALAVAAPVFAQGAYIGAKAGWTRTNTKLEVSGTKQENLDARNSVQGGIQFGYGFSPTVAIQADVLWSGKGFKTAVPVAVPLQATPIVEWTLNYVEVPVVIVASVPAGETLDVRLMGGVSFGFESSCRVKLNAASEDVGCGDPTATKSPDIGIPLGVGVAFDMGSSGRTQLFVDAGYTIGVTDVSESTDISLKNNLMAFTIGIKRSFGG